MGELGFVADYENIFVYDFYSRGNSQPSQEQIMERLNEKGFSLSVDFTEFMQDFADDYIGLDGT
jgi:hypothetical protein